MYYAKTPKLFFRAGDLNLPERRKKYMHSRVEEEEGAQSCPGGNANESTTHIDCGRMRTGQGRTECVNR